MSKGQQQHLEGKQDGVYIVQNGQVIDVLLPKQYGQDIINWQHGAVFEVSESKRRRIKKA